MLHAQIYKLILDNQSRQGNVQQHLILITGDGNSNDNRTSFPNVVSKALDNGWTVDLWTWRASLSRKFNEIQEKYPSEMKINYLDQARSKITFREKLQQPKQGVSERKRWYLLVLLLIICTGIVLFF